MREKLTEAVDAAKCPGFALNYTATNKPPKHKVPLTSESSDRCNKL